MEVSPKGPESVKIKLSMETIDWLKMENFLDFYSIGVLYYWLHY